jgi:hypothetical protein
MNQVTVSTLKGFISLGGMAFIHKLNAYIVAKTPRAEDEPGHAIEQSIFETLESHPPHRHLVRSILRVPGATFLAFLPGGDLASLLETTGKRSQDPASPGGC